MIQKKIKSIFILGFLFILAGCSSDYDNSINVDTEGLNFVTLTTNLEGKSVLGMEEPVTFQLINDANGEDISEAATFYVNQEEISGNAYTFQEAGSYEVYSTVEDLTSNNITLDVVDGNYVSTDVKKALKGQTITFKSFDTNGNEITNESGFIVNGNPISGNEFSSDQAGTYSVTAQHQGNTSEATNFEVFSASRKIALEDYTGTWCGWCPRVLLVIEELEEVTSNTVTLAIHSNDVMEFDQEELLRETLDVGNSLPKLHANRTESISVSQDSEIPTAVEYIASMAGSETNNAIAINTKLAGNRLKVDVKITATEALPSSYKLAVYLYQDGLHFEQTNYYNNVETSQWFQAGNPIPDFTHNHVLEASLTENVLGDNIESVSAYEVRSKNIGAIDLSSYARTDNGNTFDPENYGVAVFLVDENNNALNAQSVKAGKSIDFDE